MDVDAAPSTVVAGAAGIIIIVAVADVPKEGPDPPKLLRVDRRLQQEVALQHIFIRIVGTADVASGIIISINGNLAALFEKEAIQPGRRALYLSLGFVHIRIVRIR